MPPRAHRGHRSGSPGRRHYNRNHWTYYEDRYIPRLDPIPIYLDEYGYPIDPWFYRNRVVVPRRWGFY